MLLILPMFFWLTDIGNNYMIFEIKNIPNELNLYNIERGIENQNIDCNIEEIFFERIILIAPKVVDGQYQKGIPILIYTCNGQVHAYKVPVTPKEYNKLHTKYTKSNTNYMTYSKLLSLNDFKQLLKYYESNDIRIFDHNSADPLKILNQYIRSRNNMNDHIFIDQVNNETFNIHHIDIKQMKVINSYRILDENAIRLLELIETMPSYSLDIEILYRGFLKTFDSPSDLKLALYDKNNERKILGVQNRVIHLEDNSFRISLKYSELSNITKIEMYSSNFQMLNLETNTLQNQVAVTIPSTKLSQVVIVTSLEKSEFFQGYNSITELQAHIPDAKRFSRNILTFFDYIYSPEIHDNTKKIFFENFPQFDHSKINRVLSRQGTGKSSWGDFHTTLNCIINRTLTWSQSNSAIPNVTIKTYLKQNSLFNSNNDSSRRKKYIVKYIEEYIQTFYEILPKIPFKLLLDDETKTISKEDITHKIAKWFTVEEIVDANKEKHNIIYFQLTQKHQ